LGGGLAIAGVSLPRLHFQPKHFKIVQQDQACDPSRQLTIFSTFCQLLLFARRHATNWHDGQISAFPKPQISCLITAILFRQEGRSRVVTNVGWDAVDAAASA
jgi:hypothetical protein